MSDGNQFAKFLKKNVVEISNFSIEDLEKYLITSDGKGKEFKKAALEEIKRRILCIK